MCPAAVVAIRCDKPAMRCSPGCSWPLPPRSPALPPTPHSPASAAGSRLVTRLICAHAQLACVPAPAPAPAQLHQHQRQQSRRRLQRPPALSLVAPRGSSAWRRGEMPKARRDYACTRARAELWHQAEEQPPARGSPRGCARSMDHAALSLARRRAATALHLRCRGWPRYCPRAALPGRPRRPLQHCGATKHLLGFVRRARRSAGRPPARSSATRRSAPPPSRACGRAAAATGCAAPRRRGSRPRRRPGCPPTPDSAARGKYGRGGLPAATR